MPVNSIRIAKWGPGNIAPVDAIAPRLETINVLDTAQSLHSRHNSLLAAKSRLFTWAHFPHPSFPFVCRALTVLQEAKKWPSFLPAIGSVGPSEALQGYLAKWPWPSPNCIDWSPSIEISNGVVKGKKEGWELGLLNAGIVAWLSPSRAVYATFELSRE